MAIDIRWYDAPVDGDATRAGGPVVFLAGPTTDGNRLGRSWFAGRMMSSWRAELGILLARADWTGTIVVPEFHVKGVDDGWFAKRAAEHFGNTPMPAGMPEFLLADRGPRMWDPSASVGLIQWEENQMEAADLVVAWADVRDTQPGLGLNARPEIYGLMLRWRAAAGAGVMPIWSPRRLLLGIPETARSVTRLWLEAASAGLPVVRTLEEMAWAIVAATRIRQGADQ